MSFYEDLATALDAEGIESRVHDDILFVPISAGVDIQCEVTNEILPAANIYIAAAVEPGDEGADTENAMALAEDPAPVLVSAVFSVAAAVAIIMEHMATGVIVDIVDELVNAPAGRFVDLEFSVVDQEPVTLRSGAGENSELDIVIEIVDGEPTATVTLTAFDRDIDDLIEDQREAADESVAGGLDCLAERFIADGTVVPEQTMGLGSYTDFERLLTILPFIAEHAAEWEEELMAAAKDYEDPFFDDGSFVGYLSEDDLDS